MIRVQRDGAVIEFDQYSVGRGEGCTDHTMPITGHGNGFSGGSDATVLLGRRDGNQIELHDNHILNNGGLSVRVYAQRTDEDPDHIDLSDNYWGTTDPAQIAMWIND